MRHHQGVSEYGVENMKEDIENPIPLPPMKIDMEKLELPPKLPMEFIHGIKGQIMASKPERINSILTKIERDGLSQLTSLLEEMKIFEKMKVFEKNGNF